MRRIAWGLALAAVGSRVGVDAQAGSVIVQMETDAVTTVSEDAEDSYEDSQPQYGGRVLAIRVAVSLVFVARLLAPASVLKLSLQLALPCCCCLTLDVGRGVDRSPRDQAYTQMAASKAGYGRNQVRKIMGNLRRSAQLG